MSSRPPRTPPPTTGNHSGGPQHSPRTPRQRKSQSSSRLQGIRPLSEKLQPENIRARLKDALVLSFDPDDFQVELLSRILRGYDSLLCAGTGYGKSLIFEGLAVLGGKTKVVVVICPLKALERDQVRPAFMISLTLIPILGLTGCPSSGKRHPCGYGEPG